MDAVQIASRLISIPSFSGREHAISNWVEAYLRRIGAPVVQRLPVEDSADTIVARWEGATNSNGLLLSFHMDIEELSSEWKGDPFDPRIENGRLYGAGSHDMKAGAAAILAAIQNRPRLARPLVIAATTDEMRWSRGAHAAIRCELLQGCRYALVGEPSPEATFHDGGHGRHILVLNNADLSESQFQDRVRIRRENGKLIVNAYVLPGRGAKDLVESVRRLVPRDTPIEVDPRPTPAPPSYQLPESSRIVRALRKAIGPHAKTVLSKNVCDAHHFMAFAGIESVIYGPTGGNTDRGDEYVDVNSLMQVTETYRRLLQELKN